MAEVFKSVIGRLTGALGNMVFRNRGETTFITMRPKSFTAGNDLAAKNRRARFGLTGMFATAVNQDANLKHFWDLSTPASMTAANGIFKSNYKHITPDDVTDLARLTPGINVKVSDRSSSMTNLLVSATLDPIGTDQKIDLLVETSIQMVAIIYCKDPLNEDESKNHFICLKSAEMPLSLAAELAFTIPLMGDETQYFDVYAEQKCFYTFVTLDSEGVPYHYTNTLIIS
ncbi:MAG: hypothetical protein WCK13_10610 [Ignavibacteriota bacterium]